VLHGASVPAPCISSAAAWTSDRLESAGNVIIRGRLVMQPASPEVEHRLIFAGAREASFAGGGMEVLGSDVGLWVMDGGVLDVAGTPPRS
jgi:hypothetical protein